MTENRELILKFRVNRDEHNWIENRFTQSGLKSRSEFISRTVILSKIVNIRKQAEKAVSGELIEELKKSVQAPQKDGIKRRKKEISDVQKDVESVQSRLRKSFESYADGIHTPDV